MQNAQKKLAAARIKHAQHWSPCLFVIAKLHGEAQNTSTTPSRLPSRLKQ